VYAQVATFNIKK